MAIIDLGDTQYYHYCNCGTDILYNKSDIRKDGSIICPKCLNSQDTTYDEEFRTDSWDMECMRSGCG